MVLGSGRPGAVVLGALVPAVIQRQGTVSVIVSPTVGDKASQLRSANYQALADVGTTLLTVDIAGSTMETPTDRFRRFTTIINCTGFVAGPGIQLKITHAALVAGVPHYFLWQFGVDYDVVSKDSGQPVWDEQYDVRILLRAWRATEWTIVSTGMFTSSLFGPDSGVVNLSNQTLHVLDNWDIQVTATSLADIGRLTATIYLRQPWIANGMMSITGGATSCRQLIDIVEHVTQQTFGRVAYTPSALLEQLQTNPDDVMLCYRTIFIRGDDMWWPMSDTWNARHQLSARDIAGQLQTAR